MDKIKNKNLYCPIEGPQGAKSLQSFINNTLKNVCAQLFISDVCMCSVIYNLCMCVLSLLNWNVAILLFIKYDANKIKTIKCHLCHVCAELFIRYVFFHFKNFIGKSLGLDNRLCLYKSSPTTRTIWTQFT